MLHLQLFEAWVIGIKTAPLLWQKRRKGLPQIIRYKGRMSGGFVRPPKTPAVP